MGSPDLQAVATESWAEGWAWLLWGKEKGKEGDCRGVPIASNGDMEGFTVEVSLWDSLRDKRLLAVTSIHWLLQAEKGNWRAHLREPLSPCRPDCWRAKDPGDPHPQPVHVQAECCQPRDIRPPRPAKPRAGEETGHVSQERLFLFFVTYPLIWGWRELILQGLPWPDSAACRPRLWVFQGLPRMLLLGWSLNFAETHL